MNISVTVGVKKITDFRCEQSLTMSPSWLVKYSSVSLVSMNSEKRPQAKRKVPSAIGLQQGEILG